MIVTTYCTAQSLILQLISSDELLVLLWVSVIEVTVGAGGWTYICRFMHLHMYVYVSVSLLDIPLINRIFSSNPSTISIHRSPVNSIYRTFTVVIFKFLSSHASCVLPGESVVTFTCKTTTKAHFYGYTNAQPDYSITWTDTCPIHKQMSRTVSLLVTSLTSRCDDVDGDTVLT